MLDDTSIAVGRDARVGNADDILDTTACPLCGSPEFVIVQPNSYPPDLDRQGLLEIYKSSSEHKLMDQLVRCKGCELLYLNPRPRNEIILASYSTAVDPVFFSQNPMRISTFRRAFERTAKRTGIALGPNTRVLDIGCAGGAFPKAAHDLGCEVVGIEPSQWLCDTARSTYGLDIRCGVLSDFTFDDASFDVVTLWDVVEHLFDPIEVLEQIRRIVKPSGHLVVNYPDIGSVVARLLGRRWPFLLSVHLTYFTRRTVTKLLQKTGFDVLEIRPFFQTLTAAYVARRAKAYVPAFGHVEAVLQRVGLGNVPFTYNLGQCLVVARPAP